ncbi:MAG: phenylalanine--tRNA ligase subunit beta [Alphaproteobacteria bacterium]|nr:MAG: phenylalanine--tRNA ligase subunit beta [Alphaproteobacteria bacterium]
MKFTLAWLKRHLDTDAPVEEIARTLTRIGLEVESVEDPRPLLAPFRIARVVSAEPHPNADRLKVCMVDTGDRTVQVVCGASNARAGMTGVFAPPGTHVPGTGVDLKPAKIRGVESRGMLCSERELMISDDHEGIIDLPADAPLGASYMEYAGLDDPVIDIAVTPNRPDALGVAGIARDLAAAGCGRFKDEKIAPVPATFASGLDIVVEDETACPFFAGRWIRGVKNGESPDWLKHLLSAVGLRPISVLVDITNFVNLDRARPLHVYDAAKVQGAIRARRARPGERLVALDGREYECFGGECLIADDRGPLGFGGVMGGEASGVTAETTEVIVESALFDPVLTAETGRRHGIESDARYRFERGVDPAFTLPGMELATRLILDLAGGEPGDVVSAGHLPEGRRTIAFAPERVESLGGLALERSEIRAILGRLGFDWQEEVAGGRVHVRTPSWRPDVEGEADLVEEVLRIAGYDRIPAVSLPRGSGVARPILTAGQKRARRARRCCASRGLKEAVTWSFMDGDLADRFGGDLRLALANPIASHLNRMRPSVLPNLVQAAGRNRDRAREVVGLFEVGAVYHGPEPEDQEEVAGAVRAGMAGPPHWAEPQRPVDVFDAKADALALLEALGVPVDRLQVRTPGPDWFHPGRSGMLCLGPKKVLAHFGELHPGILSDLDVRGPVVGAEVFLDRLPGRRRKGGAARPELQASRLPPVDRDFAFLVPADLPAEQLIATVRGAARELIEGIDLFDRYAGEGLPEDMVSLALRVRLRPRERTLADAEIDEIARRIVAAAEKRCGARLRG